MKTKTIIKIFSVFFIFTLFFTSCSTDEIISQEQIEIIDLSNVDDSNNTSRVPRIMEVKVTYEDWVDKDQMDIIRAYYATTAGLLTYEFNGDDEEIWTVNENIFRSYSGSCATCSDPLDVVIESEEEVKGVDIP